MGERIIRPVVSNQWLRYLGGVNAVLAFTVLVLLARTLPADEYAAYVSAFAPGVPSCWMSSPAWNG